MVLLNVVQASIFYAAPMLALVQFLKELRRPRKHHHHPPSSSSSTALSPAPRYPYRTPEGATAVMYPPYPSSDQQPYPMESGGGAMALAAMESTDFRALAGLLGRTLAQWTALTALLGLAGRLIQSLADSTSGGGNPLITTLDVLVSGAAVFLSDQIGFLNFRVSRQQNQGGGARGASHGRRLTATTGLPACVAYAVSRWTCGGTCWS